MRLPQDVTVLELESTDALPNRQEQRTLGLVDQDQDGNIDLGLWVC